ncbi:alpha/beta fold hydrolase [Fundidesulfovibrio terrae]|uniref:alpha/beta fold hydrolase n=1 Tax=Fundidesulfovibrio terrae TaxID=2922866 RepID=UPI001FAFB198|nr:alpha/beta hydrolase [Fundidesulfovibrio terrae]
MKKESMVFTGVRIMCALALALVAASGVALAKDVSPVGEKVAVDGNGHAIYQVEANGIRIGYKLIGSGEPLLLLTGLGCTMDRWTPAFIEEASGKYQLIIMDNRGMGYTTDNGQDFTYTLFAKDVISLLDSLGVGKTNVLGYSQSSVTTQNLLLEYPDRVGKAIIHATSTDGKAVAAAFKSVPLPDNPTIKKQLEAAMGWESPLDKMALIKNQVMLLVGTADTIVGTQSSKTLAGLIPGAWLVQFKNGTHHLQFEAPVEFSRIVLTFLEMNETVPTPPQ